MCKNTILHNKYLILLNTSSLDIKAYWFHLFFKSKTRGVFFSFWRENNCAKFSGLTILSKLTTKFANLGRKQKKKKHGKIYTIISSRLSSIMAIGVYVSLMPNIIDRWISIAPPYHQWKKHSSILLIFIKSLL